MLNPSINDMNQTRARHPQRASAFRPDIQGLRAVAVMAVIAHHLFEYAPGFVGVDIFFVVSGYLIGGLLLRELTETGKVDLGQFFSARMKRLLPNALLVLSATMAMTLAIIPASEWSMITSNVTAAALYYSNFAFADQSIGYFHPHLKDNPVVHFWSLSIEEQFYVGLATLFAITAVLGKASRHWALAVVYGITAISFSLAVLADPDRSQSNFFLSQFRFWEFGIGIIAVAHEKRLRELSRPVLLTLSSLSTALWLSIFVLPLQTYPWPGPATLLPTVSTAVLLATLTVGHPAQLILSHKFARWVGDRSYSLYLWHWPIMVFIGYLFGADPIHGLLALGLTFLLAEIAWRLVETPFRKKIPLGWKATMAGLAACVCVAVVAPVSQVTVETAAPTKVERGQWLSENKSSRSAVNKAGCFSSIGRWSDYDSCVFGNPEGEVRILLWGDSHAMSWFDGIEPVAKALDQRLEVALMQACPPYLHPRFYHAVKGVYDECMRFTQTTFDRVMENPPQIVILGSAPRYNVLLDPNNNILPIQEGRLAEQEALTAMISALESAGVVVILAIDPPKVQRRYDACVAAGNSMCSFQFPESDMLNTDRLVAQALGSRIIVANFVDAICPQDICVTFDKGRFTYRDQTHLNPAFSAALAERWNVVIKQAMARL